MSNPIFLYIVPKCDMEIEIAGFKEWDPKKQPGPTDGNISIEYKIKRFGSIEIPIPPENKKDFMNGLMSPIDRVSLPPHSMKQAGIPKDAKYFAYLHPPERLCWECFDNYDFENPFVDGPDQNATTNQDLQMTFGGSRNREEIQETTDDNKKRRIAQFSVCGAFVYFDENMDIISINTVSFFRQSENRLTLSGPFITTDLDKKRMIELNRTRSTRTQLLHECGFVAMAWQRPIDSEKLQKIKGIRGNEFSGTFNQDVHHGRFIFYKDDGSAISYQIDRNRKQILEHPGRTFECSLADAFQCALTDRPSLEENSSSSVSQNLFVEEGMRHDDFISSRQRVLQALLRKDIDHKRYNFRDQYDTPVLHQAIKCKFKVVEIREIIDKFKETNDVDKFYGWTPLHYACRYQADNEELVHLLLKECDIDALIKRDMFDRYPLHIACGSGACAKVIELLLDVENKRIVKQNREMLESRKDQTKEWLEGGHLLPSEYEEDKIDHAAINMSIELEEQQLQVISSTSKHLKLLPLHIACYSGASMEVLKLLLDADKHNSSGQSIKSKTKVGGLPLHLVIQKKMKFDVIQLLVEFEKSIEIDESIINGEKPDVTRKLLDSEIISKNNSIYQRYHGLLPIHMASLNGLDIKSVRLLVEADVQGTSIGARARVGASQMPNSPGSKTPSDPQIVGQEESENSTRADDNFMPGSGNPSDKKMGDHEESGPRASSGLMPDTETSDDQKMGDDEESGPRVSSGLPYDTKRAGGQQISSDAVDASEVEESENEEFPNSQLDQRILNMDSFMYYNSTERSEENTIFAKPEKDELPENLAFLSEMRALQMSIFSKSDNITTLILQRENRHNNSNSPVDVEKRQELAKSIDADHRTCLHLACKNNCSAEIIKLLLVLDPMKESSKMLDSKGSCPLHLACHQKAANIEVIKALIDVDIDMNVKSVSMKDKLQRNPFSLAVKSKASSNVLELLLQPENFDIAGFHDREINELAVRVKNDLQLRKCVNFLLAQRVPFGIFYFYLIVHAFTAILFVQGCDGYIKGEYFGNAKLVSLLILTSLLASREIVQLGSEGWKYILDHQSYFEVANILLLYMSATVFIDGAPNDRTVLILTSFLLLITSVAVLRNSFLQFSHFAGGLIVILRTLVPFFLVSCLLLFAFSHSLRLNLAFLPVAIIPNTKCNAEPSFKDTCSSRSDNPSSDCFLAVLNIFFGGSDTKDILDVAFGAIILLVLLNVNIAIVSDAWENAKDLATDMFWRARLSYLAEISQVTFFHSKVDKPGFFEWIDEQKNVSLRGPNVSWSKDFPYNSVWKQDEYFKPRQYFPLDMARTIEHARSVQSDRYWLGKASIDPNNALNRSQIIRYWSLRSLRYVVLICFGSFLGILWPEDFRLLLVSLGTTYESHEGKQRKKEEAERRKDEDGTVMMPDI